MTNDEVTTRVPFVIRASSLIRYSALVIRHSAASHIYNAVHPLSHASALRFGPTDKAIGDAIH